VSMPVEILARSLYSSIKQCLWSTCKVRIMMVTILELNYMYLVLRPSKPDCDVEGNLRSLLGIGPHWPARRIAGKQIFGSARALPPTCKLGRR